MRSFDARRWRLFWNEVMNEFKIPDDLQRCVDFHGHLCPGVVIGYCAAKLGMKLLSTNRASDEECIAIVENDSCAVDAIQVLTGCTFGKGNLFFRDYGKMVFTFATRSNHHSVRLRFEPNSQSNWDNLPENQRQKRRIEFMLSHDPEELFDIRNIPLACLPATAQIQETIPCDYCNEMVMASRLRQYGKKHICIPCDEAVQKGE